MTSILRKIFTPAAKPAAAPAQDAIHGPQNKPLSMKSPTDKLGSRLRAAFTGCTSKAARNAPPLATPPKALTSRSVQSWNAGKRPVGPQPVPRATLSASAVEAPSGHASSDVPLAFTLSAKRDGLPTSAALEDLEPDSASSAASRDEGLDPGLVSTLSDQASLDHEARPANLYPTWTAPATPDFDAMFDEFETSETEDASPGAAAPTHGALLAELTADDGEGLSDGAARAVIGRMSTGASREDALDALRDGQLGVPGYEVHASTGVAGGWGADD